MSFLVTFGRKMISLTTLSLKIKKITRSKQKICNENGSERRDAFARIFGQNVEEALCHDPVRVGPGHGLDLKAWALKMMAHKLGALTCNSLIKAWSLL